MDLIAKPFGKLLLLLYNFTGNYGIAIFLFAFVVKLVLLPFSMKSKKSIMRSTRFTPYLKKLEKKYEGNKQKYQEEVAKLYREEHINPMSGCLWSLIPFPILLALYRAIRFPITIMMGVSEDVYETIKTLLASLGYDASALSTRGAAYSQLYESQFISGHFDQFAGISDKLQQIDYHFLGLDLGRQPSWRFWEFGANGELWPQLGLFLIPVISAVLSWLQSKISTSMSAATPETAGTGRSMMLMLPLMSLWIGFIMPGALGLYWIATSVFSIIQESLLTVYYNKKLDAEDEERNARLKARDEEIERKRLETERAREEGNTVVNPNTSRRKLQAGERQRAEQKAAEWQAVHNPAKNKKDTDSDPSRVGDRPYARGRAYVPDRFDNIDAVPDIDETDDAGLISDGAEETGESGNDQEN